MPRIWYHMTKDIAVAMLGYVRNSDSYKPIPRYVKHSGGYGRLIRICRTPRESPHHPSQ
jgi:hypothetical protein